MKNTFRRTIGVLAAAFMATQLFGAATTADVRFQSPSSGAFEQAAPATPSQKEVERLLKRISSNAAIVGRHAATLESHTRGTRLGYQTNAAELSRAKDAINAMGADFRRLQELRPGALPWQQAVIDRIQPMLAGLAGHATEAIELLNRDRGRFHSREYRDAIGNLRAYAGQARNLIAVNLDYAQAREKLNRPGRGGRGVHRGSDSRPQGTIGQASQEPGATGAERAVEAALLRCLRLPGFSG